MEKSNNIIILNVFVAVYLFQCCKFYLTTPLSSFQTSFLTLLFFSFLFKKFKYSIFLILSSLFLILFLTFSNLNNLTFSNFLKITFSENYLLTIYSYILTPFVFLSWHIEFYELPYQLTHPTMRKFFFFFILIFNKKRLLLKRFSSLEEILHSRGVGIRSFFGKERTIFNWLPPLIISTIIEGIETSEYCKMVNANYKEFSPTYKKYTFNSIYKYLLYFQFALLIVIGVYYLWKNI